MGVSGSGKSTIGAQLAARMDAEFIDADDLHSDASKSKLAAGIALTDADRAPWLARVGTVIRQRRRGGRSVVVACSALRRAYRDGLRAAAGDLEFIHLAGTRELLAHRLGARIQHFMSTHLLDSQLSTLEPLEPDEGGITLDIVDAPEDAVARILESARTSWIQVSSQAVRADRG